MIPSRSASVSASSRYWVVRNTVTPSLWARRATSSQRAARLWMSSPVVGSSRNRTRGPWIRARARSRRRLIPPEYPPTRRSAASASPTRSSSSSPRSSNLGRREAVEPTLEAHVLPPRQQRSSAASCSATPITSRTAGPSPTMSWPPTRAAPAVGGSSVVSMWTVVDFPRRWGPEPVDLAGRDLEVDPRRRGGRS